MTFPLSALGLDWLEQPMRRAQSDGDGVVANRSRAAAASRLGGNVVRVWGHAACGAVAMVVKRGTAPSVLELSTVGRAVAIAPCK